ncbi:hypothetical protein BaRGS_00030456, partial [Batillaria attramentaria]
WSQSQSQDIEQYAPTKDNFRRLDTPTDKTIDQLITEALGGIDVASNKILAPGEKVLAELDMYLTQEQFLSLYEPPSSNLMIGPPLAVPENLMVRQKRKAIRDVINRWTNAEVPYQFARGDFSDKEQYMIKQALTEWERYTCMKFRPAMSADSNILRFQNGASCSSQVGMVGGVQLLNLDVAGCRFKGLYLHEVGHAIGLFHEHQLPDRDNYIEILYNNVAPHFRSFFNKYSRNSVNQFGVPYEYTSVMHYGITAFSYNGQAQTIRTKDPSKEASIGKVYLKELSFSDVKVVNEMYSCSAYCPDTVTCTGTGYLDQNCNCVCPDGSKDCEVRSDKKDEDADSTDDVDEGCRNLYDDWKCSVWANQGECDRNPKYMKRSCMRACGLCEKEKKQQDSACKDVYSFEKCTKWRQQGDCVTNADWMSNNCKMTCNFCGNPALRPETNCRNRHADDDECDRWALDGECMLNHGCHDIHNAKDCRHWAAHGECTNNPDWMIANCRESCAKCEDGTCKNLFDDVQCKIWAEEMECVMNREWMHTNCAMDCGVPEVWTTTQPDTATCYNEHNDVECDIWAQTGHCDINPVWMIPNCKKACRRCYPVTTTAVASVCEDKDPGCAGWAKSGYCEKNPRYNLIFCKKSCNNCNGCRDEEFLCAIWAKAGHCMTNAAYMLRHCQKSCKEACM